MSYVLTPLHYFSHTTKKRKGLCFQNIANLLANDKHNDLDAQIINLEKDPVAAGSRDDEIEALKKQKLQLKDEIYKILEDNKHK